MKLYHPEINCAAHSLEWLQTRRNELARAGLSGSMNEKRSAQRKAELAAIDAGIRAKGVKPTQVPRTRPLPQSAIGDTAYMQPHAVANAPVRAGVCGYSAAVQAVSRAYKPKQYSTYP